MVKGKRGQFYFLSALIIIGLLVGFTTVMNYSKKETFEDISNLGEEVEIEGNAVLEQIENNPSIDEVGRFESFAETYKNKEEKQNLYFIFGNRDKINFVKYQELETESISVNGIGVFLLDGTVRSFSSPADPTRISIGADNYDFDLTETDEIHFIISQNFGGEKHVVSN
jgi:hypothetical protein